MTSLNNNKEFISVMPVLKIGLKYWYIFIIAAIISVGIGIVYIKMTRPVLKFATNIMIKENESSGMSGISAAMLRNLPFGNLSGGGVSVYDELEVLASFTTYRETVQKLGLNIDYIQKDFPKDTYFYNNSPIEIKSITNIADTLKSTLLFNIKYSSDKCVVKVYKSGILKKLIGEASLGTTLGTVSTLYGNFTIIPTTYFNPKKKYTIKAKFVGYDLAAELLQEKVEVDLVSKKANLINISTTECDIKKGKDILNSLIDVYNGRGLEQKREIANSTIKFLDGRLNVIYDELSGFETSIESYKKKNDLTDIEVELKAIFANSGEFKKQQLEIETQYVVMKYMEDFMADPQNKYSLIPLNIGGLNDSKAIEGLLQYNDALLERMKLLKSTSESNPMIVASNEQIGAMRINLLNTIKGLKSGLEVTRNKLREQEKLYETRLKNAPTQEREFVDLKRQQYLKQELYMYLLQQREENVMKLAETAPKSQVIDAAYCLYKPVSPKMMFIGIMVVILTGIISISFIATREYYRKKKA